MMNPDKIAVNKPASGVNPEAIANAIAKGKATTPTVIPAAMSVNSRSEL
jgi:hypothetical protein